MKWIRVTYAENIPVRQGRSVKIGSYAVAIFNLGDAFRTVENSCPHRNGPLADGIVAGNDVVCPLHNWRFSLDSGEVRNQPGDLACVRTFETKVVDGVVMVRLPEDSENLRFALAPAEAGRAAQR
jgi:nitrite reductase (NADH) small subunit